MVILYSPWVEYGLRYSQRIVPANKSRVMNKVSLGIFDGTPGDIYKGFGITYSTVRGISFQCGFRSLNTLVSVGPVVNCAAIPCSGSDTKKKIEFNYRKIG